jgi:predicted MFS family arabinose efflux permease
MASSYWILLVAVLLSQFSANVSHGPLQGLIPDLVPEDQRGVASAVKASFELVPLILLGITVAPLVGAGRFNLAVIFTGVSLLVLMLLTMVWVKETPMKDAPGVALAPAMVRTLGMLAGIAIGGLAGLVAGGIVGGLAGMAAWPFMGPGVAASIAVAVGGIVAMAVAVVAGVWAGTLTTIGREVRGLQSFTWWVVNRLMFLAAITSIQGFAPYFLMYAFGVRREAAASMTGTLMMVVGVFTLISALPSGWLADRLGQKRLVSVSGIVAALGTIVVMTTIWVPNLRLIYVAGCLLGLSAGLFTTTNWALGSRLVPAREAGRYLGISNLAGAGAGMIGTGIGGPMADYLNGSRPGSGYLVIFAGYAILFVLSVVALKGISQPERRRRQERVTSTPTS